MHTGGGLAADISLGAINGAAAVPYVHSMIQAAPPLKCLVLFIKALLKVCHNILSFDADANLESESDGENLLHLAVTFMRVVTSSSFLLCPFCLQT